METAAQNALHSLLLTLQLQRALAWPGRTRLTLERSLSPCF